MPKGASRSEAPFIDFSSSSSSAVPANISFAEPLGDLPFGAELHSVTRRFSFAPVKSIDYHNVLDRVNVSRRRLLKLSATGQLHNQVTAAVGAVLGNPFQVLVLSYCHHEATRQNVRRACIGNSSFNPVSNCDRPTCELGKLSVLRQVISEELLDSRPCRVYHIDDSLGSSQGAS